MRLTKKSKFCNLSIPLLSMTDVVALVRESFLAVMARAMMELLRGWGLERLWLGLVGLVRPPWKNSVCANKGYEARDVEGDCRRSIIKYFT